MKEWVLDEQTGRWDYVEQDPPEPVAKTAGEQDHSDPWRFAGEDADPPVSPR